MSPYSHWFRLVFAGKQDLVTAQLAKCAWRIWYNMAAPVWGSAVSEHPLGAHFLSTERMLQRENIPHTFPSLSFPLFLEPNRLWVLINLIIYIYIYIKYRYVWSISLDVVYVKLVQTLLWVDGELVTRWPQIFISWSARQLEFKACWLLIICVNLFVRLGPKQTTLKNLKK